MKNKLTLKEKVKMLKAVHRDMTMIAGTKVSIGIFLKHHREEAIEQKVPHHIVNGAGQIDCDAYLSLYLVD